MTNEELSNLLSFEGVDSVKIVDQQELHDDAALIVACVNNDLTVPFVHYANKDWLFTPWDWQDMSNLSKGIEDIKWRVNDTGVEAVIFDGLPMLAPWTPEPTDELKEARKSIGRAIKSARAEKGWTTRQLADYSGIPLSAISRIENGRLNAKIDTIAAIMRALNITFSFN